MPVRSVGTATTTEVGTCPAGRTVPKTVRVSGGVAWVTVGSDSDPVSAQVTGYQQVENRVVRARLVITARADTAAHCTLRALDEDRAVIGRAEVTSPAGGTSRGAIVDLRVLTSASSVEIVDCTAA